MGWLRGRQAIAVELGQRLVKPERIHAVPHCNAWTASVGDVSDAIQRRRCHPPANRIRQPPWAIGSLDRQ
ncbi:MAG: hypothetical protein H7138_17025 [Myxococcales bacterium]|nr:hypothetical protein [Myxococcales bacterium]